VPFNSVADVFLRSVSRLRWGRKLRTRL